MFFIYWLLMGTIGVAVLLIALIKAKDSKTYTAVKNLMTSKGVDIDADFDNLGVLCTLGTVAEGLSRRDGGGKKTPELLAETMLEVYWEAKETFGKDSGNLNSLYTHFVVANIIMFVFGFILTPLLAGMYLLSDLKK